MTPQEEFGRRVFMARRRAGFTQETVALCTGLHRTEVGLIERGRREPKLTTILKLVRGLGIEPNDLLKGLRSETTSTKP